MADRRAHLRFQVMGSGRASMLSTERLRVVNVGLSGALVEAAFPLAPNTECQMQFVLPTHVSAATVRVRRVTPIDGPAAPARYHIGLEFLALSPEAEDAIRRLVAVNEACN